jgi:hypothetical protein
MLHRFVTVGGILVFSSATLLADFSYQEKSKITGGAMAAAMKVAGVFSKAAREPMEGAVAVKGDRMVHRSNSHISIIDLGAKTITSIDPQKKTYSVMTFEEMKQALQQMQDKMSRKQDKGADLKFKVSAKSPGTSRTINGFDTKEMVITMEMEGTDQQSGQTGAMIITMDSWLAPPASGYKEVREFYKRMGKEIDWAPGANMMAGRPDIAKGYAEAMKQMGEMDGMPVMQVVSMGAAGTAGTSGGNQQASQPQQQQQSERPSLGGMLGRLGKKKQQDQSAQSTPPPAGAASGAPNSLLEMTMEMSGFSAAPVDEALFAVPAGYKKVEADIRRAAQ